MSLDPPEPENPDEFFAQLERMSLDLWLCPTFLGTSVVRYLISREIVPIPNRYYDQVVDRLRAVGVIEGEPNSPAVMRARLARKRALGE